MTYDDNVNEGEPTYGIWEGNRVDADNYDVPRSFPCTHNWRLLYHKWVTFDKAVAQFYCTKCLEVTTRSFTK